MNRRQFLKLTGGSVAMVTLAACAAPVTQAPSGEGSVAGSVAPEATTLTFWAPDCDVQCWVNIDRYLNRYQSEVNPNVQFEVAGPPWGDYWQRTPLAIAGGRGPDVFYMHFFQTLPFVDGGLIEPWPEERVSELGEKIAFLDTLKLDDKLYYYPDGIQTSAIFYNKKLWVEAGLTDADIPTTWDDLVGLAKEMTITNDAGEVTRSGFEWGTNDLRWTWAMLKYQLGEFMFTPDGRRGYFNTEGGRRAAEMIKTWEEVDKVGATDLTPSPHEALVNDLAVMGFAYGWVARWFTENHPDFEWGLFPLPSMDGNPAPVFDRGNPELNPGVNPQIAADRKEMGFDFIQWIGTDEEEMTYRSTLGVAPVLKSIQDDPEVLATPIVATMLDILDRTVYLGAPPPVWEDDIKLITDLIFINRTHEIDEALAEAQAAIDKTLAEPNTVTWGVSERAYAHAGELRDPEFLG